MTRARTPIIIGAFIAALIAGLLVRFLGPSIAEAPIVKEKFAQREVGMPVDFSAPAQPYDGTSPLLGSDPKPVPQKPYEKADDTQLFLFAGNKVGAECCPSVFSTDSGCLCLTDEQKNSMVTRGGNRGVGPMA